MKKSYLFAVLCLFLFMAVCIAGFGGCYLDNNNAINEEVINDNTEGVTNDKTILIPNSEGGGNSILQRTRIENARRILKINAADWQDVMSLVTDDFEYQEPILSVTPKTTYYAYIERIMASQTNLELIIEDELIVNGLYSATWHWTGFWMGIPYIVRGMSIVKFRDNDVLAYYQKDYFTEGDIWINIPGVGPIIQMLRDMYRAQVLPNP